MERKQAGQSPGLRVGREEGFGELAKDPECPSGFMLARGLSLPQLLTYPALWNFRFQARDDLYGFLRVVSNEEKSVHKMSNLVKLLVFLSLLVVSIQTWLTAALPCAPELTGEVTSWS